MLDLFYDWIHHKLKEIFSKYIFKIIAEFTNVSLLYYNELVHYLKLTSLILVGSILKGLLTVIVLKL